MGQYMTNAAAVRDLVRETEVHRDVYVDQEIFDLEMEHLFWPTPDLRRSVMLACPMPATTTAPRSASSRC
jgi:hypothetical protein